VDICTPHPLKADPWRDQQLFFLVLFCSCRRLCLAIPDRLGKEEGASGGLQGCFDYFDLPQYVIAGDAADWLWQ
jgi:hypothetical protein